MKEFYRVEQRSEFCKSLLNSKDFASIEEAHKEYDRVCKLGYNASTLLKITQIK